MKYLYFFSVCFLCFFTTIDAAKSLNRACLEKKKVLALLETVDSFLTKAKVSFPSCVDNATSDCEGRESLAYIEISKNLVADIRNNLPTCAKDDRDYNFVCSDILASGYNESGIYTIWLGETHSTRKQLEVYCDMETDGGGWTMIQRRGKFKVQQDFYLDWESYKNGFGNISEEFWLGNEYIRVLCHKGCKIRFDMIDHEGVKGLAVYQNFNLSRDDYRISIGDFSGDIVDNMQFHNNCTFSTKDEGFVDTASTHKSGWWHINSTFYVNLNGVYQPGKFGQDTVLWWSWRSQYNLDSVEIKVKPN